uniref:Uncharacterized protein n=1 Tax=Zosterops lateralis melanops TaxID=1220523 RepID=A0A8D2QNT0_ZOSLA
KIKHKHGEKWRNRAASAVALQDHIIHSQQLQDLLLTDSAKQTNSRYWTKKKEYKSKEDAEKEYLLDPSAPQLTLGVVEHPSLSLPAEEWVKRRRSTHHGKSIQRCAIFKKEFAIQPRMKYIVSNCNYKFFQSCLKTFEKFTVIHDGACSLKLSELGKPYFCYRCKEYKDLREAVTPKDKKIRKAIIWQKVMLYLLPWSVSLRQFSFLKPELLNISCFPFHFFLLIHTKQAALEPLSRSVSLLIPFSLEPMQNPSL